MVNKEKITKRATDLGRGCGHTNIEMWEFILDKGYILNNTFHF